MRFAIRWYAIGMLLLVACGGDSNQETTSGVGQAGSGASGDLGTSPADHIPCGTATCTNLANGNPAYLGAGLASFSLGCVALSDAKLRAAVVDLPAPQRCDGMAP